RPYLDRGALPVECLQLVAAVRDPVVDADGELRRLVAGRDDPADGEPSRADHRRRMERLMLAAPATSTSHEGPGNTGGGADRDDRSRGEPDHATTPPAEGRRTERGEHRRCELAGRVRLGHEIEQRVGHTRVLADKALAGRAVIQVRQKLGALSPGQGAEREIGGALADHVAGRVAHGAGSVAAWARRSLSIARRILDFAVPTGMRSRSATSSAVKPKTPASTTARRCSSGTSSSALRSHSESLARTATSAGFGSCAGGESQSRSSGSTSSERGCARIASIARLRVMTLNQLATLPRRGSKVSACRQARTNASCATSSARRASRGIVIATP